MTPKGPFLNYVDKHGGAYVVNVPTNGEGEVNNPQNPVNVVYGWPLSWIPFH